MENPLLDLTGLPRFTEIEPHHVEPALDALLAEAPASREQTLAVLMEAYLDFYQQAETYQWVRAAAQGDPGLRELDLADSRANARRLLAKFPVVARSDANDSALVLAPAKLARSSASRSSALVICVS